jgi:hypothetical protein
MTAMATVIMEATAIAEEALEAPPGMVAENNESLIVATADLMETEEREGMIHRIGQMTAHHQEWYATLLLASALPVLPRAKVKPILRHWTLLLTKSLMTVDKRRHLRILQDHNLEIVDIIRLEQGRVFQGHLL